MSVHCICRFPESYAGPRYDNIKLIRFEVQVRIIAMHAWAAISHSIDYKHETDVPADLRKSLNALSALFYLADTQFESFARDAEASRKHAKEVVSRPHPAENLPLDLDTLKALAARVFPDREESEGEQWSKLLTDILAAGIKTTDDLAGYLDHKPTLASNYEDNYRSSKKSDINLTRVGATRVTLRVLSKRYREVDARMYRSERNASARIRNSEKTRDKLGLKDLD